MGAGRVIAVADLSAVARSAKADVAQLAERVLGKDEVTGSIPVIGSSLPLASRALAGERAGWLLRASAGEQTWSLGERRLVGSTAAGHDGRAVDRRSGR